MPLNLFYTIVQKSQKWPKTQIKGGSCLKTCVENNWEVVRGAYGWRNCCSVFEKMGDISKSKV